MPLAYLCGRTAADGRAERDGGRSVGDAGRLDEVKKVCFMIV